MLNMVTEMTVINFPCPHPLLQCGTYYKTNNTQLDYNSTIKNGGNYKVTGCLSLDIFLCHHVVLMQLWDMYRIYLYLFVE